MSPKKILVAVDFSACSAAALRQSVHLASNTRASLTAMHVVPMPVYVAPDAIFAPIALPSAEDFVAEAKEQWKAWPAAKELSGSIQFEVAIGVPRVHLVHEVCEHRFDTLILGAHSDRDASKALGSLASTCVQRAPANVLVVREGAFKPFRSVVACIDFTETSRYALDQAVRVAAAEGSRLRILHVYNDPWRGIGPPTAVSDALPDLDERYHNALHAKLQDFCKPLAHELGALKATYHTIRSESAGRAIVSFAKEHACDLAVLGTNAKWNIHDYLWGSTAERVVREAPCSILAVKLLN